MMKKHIFGEVMLGVGCIGAAAAAIVGEVRFGWQGAAIAVAGIASAALTWSANELKREPENAELDEFGIDEEEATIKVVKEDGVKCGVKIKKMSKFDTVAESFACILSILNAAEKNAKGSKNILFKLLDKLRREDPDMLHVIEMDHVKEKSKD